MDRSTVVLAGATGQLGRRIAGALVARQARVIALVRPGTVAERLALLRRLGVLIVQADLRSVPDVEMACAGAACVVSALAGLRDVIVDAQSVLLGAAVAAGVPRFVPSDFSIDFTGLPPGRNRNLDLRREFHAQLDAAPLAATTIFNGAFADMLTGRMPLLLFGIRRVLCWGNPDQRMDFTTMEDTAQFTACAALDASAPRVLRIAGDELSARELAALATEVTGKEFRVLRAGGLGTLEALIRVARKLSPGEREIYPAWQGMQYLRDMYDGRAKLAHLDNDRYHGMRWTKARDVLSARGTITENVE